MGNMDKARMTLMRNLSKKGWAINTSEKKGVLEALELSFGPEEWVMLSAGEEVGRGPYGRTQMKDVKAAAAGAGASFDERKKGSSDKKEASPNTQKGGGSQKKKQKKITEAQSRESGGSADSFRKVLIDNGWSSDDNGNKFSKEEFVVSFGLGDWNLTKGEELIAEGTYAEKAYAVVESALLKVSPS